MEFRPDFRQPILWRGGLDRILLTAILLLASWMTTRGRLLETSPEAWHTLVNLVILGGYVSLSLLLLWPVPRFYRAVFVLDEHGIALQRGNRRKGLAWEDIATYEWRDSFFGAFLHVTDVSDRKHKIHLPFFAALFQSGIQSILDSQLASRGRAIDLKLPSHELALRLARHPGVMPVVEMEPNVRYRYVNSDLLKMLGDIWGWWMHPLLFAIPFVAIVVKGITGSLETGFLAVGIYAVPVLGYLVFRKIDKARFLRHFDDRFILREGTLYVIQDGAEHPLLGETSPGRRLQGHASIRYGHGRTAYEMAPQFLEPAPDAT